MFDLDQFPILKKVYDFIQKMDFIQEIKLKPLSCFLSFDFFSFLLFTIISMRRPQDTHSTRVDKRFKLNKIRKQSRKFTHIQKILNKDKEKTNRLKIFKNKHRYHQDRLSWEGLLNFSCFILYLRFFMHFEKKTPLFIPVQY